jgi:2'-5' RNA ligase
VDADARWPRFTEGATIAEDPAVRRTWQYDRRPFYVAAVMLPAAGQLEGRREQVCAGLSPWCVPSAPGQPHVTLAALGTDEAAAQRAGRVLGGPCGIVIGGADSFAAAVFLRVAADRAVAAVRGSVLAAAGAEAGAPPTWVPHVTVATYRHRVDRERLTARLARWRAMPPLRLVGRTALMVVDRASERGRLRPAPAELISAPTCKS